MFPAYVAHAVPGRIRIKIPSKRGDAFYFATLEASLRNCPGLSSLQINARAASALVTFSGAGNLTVLSQFAKRNKLFLLQNDDMPNMKTLRELAFSGVNQVDHLITTGTRGHVDMQSIFFILFLGLGLQQLWRGQIMQPAIPMLWRALEILKDLES